MIDTVAVMLVLTIYIVSLFVMLLSPYDEAAFRRKYIGSILVGYDGDDNPYSSQTRYLGVERDAHCVYVGDYRRVLSNQERTLSDLALIRLLQETFP